MEYFSSAKNRKFALLIVIAYLIPQLLIISNTELSYDESYYWIYSKFMAWGYFDHPPMVSLSIWIGTHLFGENEFGVRIISTIYQFGTFYYLHKLVKPQSDVRFFLLFMALPLLNLNGFVAIPDAPIMFFSAAFFYYIKKYIDNDTFKNTVILSLIITLMFYSKYHGLLIVLLTTIAHIKFIKRKTFWGIIILTTLLYLPHVYWQYMHDFVSVKFHLFKRVEKHFDFNNILNYAGSQLILMGSTLWYLYLGFYKSIEKNAFNRILIFNSFGFLIFIFFMSFRNQIEANWTASCALAFIILFAQRITKSTRFYQFVGFNVVLLFLIKTLLLSLNFFEPDFKYGRLNELLGWKNGIVSKIDMACEGNLIVGDSYQISSKYSFYSGKIIPALHLGSRDSQYSILNLEQEIASDQRICYLTSKRKNESDLKVETYYKDPIYIVKNTTLGDLARVYGTTYEKIIRN